MCVVFLAYQCIDEYPVILASNRDEFYQRPTKPLHYWQSKGIYAGLDQEAGGTWLGCQAQNSKWAIITNYRDAREFGRQAKSRGTLVAEYLQTTQSAQEFAHSLGFPDTRPLKTGPLDKLEESGPNQKDNQNKIPDRLAQKYNGFNLLLGEGSAIYYISNRLPGIYQLTPGIYGLSNALLNTPWPKQKRGRQELQKQIDKSPADSEGYFKFLCDEQKAADTDLPNTGIGLQKERMLSSLFIRSPVYGTRSSTLFWLSGDGQARMLERDWIASDNSDSGDFQDTEVSFRLSL